MGILEEFEIDVDETIKHKKVMFRYIGFGCIRKI
jgi:hypothetical protein